MKENDSISPRSRDRNDDHPVEAGSSSRTVSIEASADKSCASILINRNIDDRVDFKDFLEKLLFRLNIHGEEIAQILIRRLTQHITEDREHKILKIRIPSPGRKDFKRLIEIFISNDKIFFKIKGVPSRKGIDGKILKIFFDTLSYPGKLLSDGTIDFREINSYPVVRAGDNLMFVSYAASGREGMNYYGSTIPVPEAREYPLILKEGVEKKDACLASEGQSVGGYWIRSLRDGVVVFEKENNRIAAIGVSNEIKLDRIDYSVGNIGSEIHCPISMKIGTIQDGFKVKIDGRVEVQVLEGGVVETTDDAVFDHVEPHSEVTASGNIQTNTVLNSVLNSVTGRVTVNREFRESRIFASQVEVKNNRGLYLNTEVETEQLDLDNVLIGGKNSVYLGAQLFNHRELLRRQAERIQLRKEACESKNAAVKENLLIRLKKLSGKIEDPKLILKFRHLIEKIQRLSFEEASSILNDLGWDIGSNLVEPAKKTFALLLQNSQQLNQIQSKIEEIEQNLKENERKISEISLTIKGTLKSSASILIYCDRKEPYVILPEQKVMEEKIFLKGHYDLAEGLKITRKKGFPKSSASK